jgi:hypothetical protein
LSFTLSPKPQLPIFSAIKAGKHTKEKGPPKEGPLKRINLQMTIYDEHYQPQHDRHRESLLEDPLDAQHHRTHHQQVYGAQQMMQA